jgi:hypothetical protein
VTVLHGDCLAVMPTLDANSVDAIVCDPPYGLSFMGKNWDHGIPGVAFWAEALRVAKPGAHLVAFGGSRTFHRLACAIEDAGWEIRDTLSWLYGSGFPKSLDVSKALDKQRNDDPDRMAVGRWLREQREAKGLPQKQIAAHWPSVTGGLTGCVANWEGGFNCPTWDQWLDLKRLVGFGDEMDAEVWRLNGRKGQPGEAAALRGYIEPTGGLHGGTGNTVGCFTGKQLAPEPYTDAAKQWAGWGTALKPAWEPIILARKPLSGTVAQTVTQWGTGAINVDACRIGADQRTYRARGMKNLVDQHAASDRPYVAGLPNRDEPEVTVSGRWPANVVLSHAPECRQVGTRKVKGGGGYGGGQGKGLAGIYGDFAGGVVSGSYNTHRDADGTETVPAWECQENCPVRLLDAQSGKLHSQDPRTRVSGTPNGCTWGDRKWVSSAPKSGGYGDNGGASRFFLTVKGERCESASIAEPTSTPSSRPGASALSGAATPLARARSQAGPVSIAGSGCSTPPPSPASTADSPANTGTIPITPTCCGSCGSALPVTDESTSSASAAAVEVVNVQVEGTRFRYEAKASRREREAGLEGMPQVNPFDRDGPSANFEKMGSLSGPRTNSHPTVKPLALMRWLCRLVCPPGGVILDPFTGSGSTGCAAVLEGFRFLGIEQEAEYVAIAERRIAHWAATVTPATPEPDSQTELEVA